MEVNIAKRVRGRLRPSEKSIIVVPWLNGEVKTRREAATLNIAV